MNSSTMYNPINESGIGNRKYSSISSEKESETKYAGHQKNEEGPVYHNEIEYNSSGNEDPSSAGYNTGSESDDKDEKKDEDDELWEKIADEEKDGKDEDEEEQTFDKLKETFTFNTPEEKKSNEKELKEEEKKKNIKSVEEVIEMMSEDRNITPIINLDEEKKKQD